MKGERAVGAAQIGLLYLNVLIRRLQRQILYGGGSEDLLLLDVLLGPADRRAIELLQRGQQAIAGGLQIADIHLGRSGEGGEVDEGVLLRLLLVVALAQGQCGFRRLLKRPGVDRRRQQGDVQRIAVDVEPLPEIGEARLDRVIEIAKRLIIWRQETAIAIDRNLAQGRVGPWPVRHGIQNLGQPLVEELLRGDIDGLGLLQGLLALLLIGRVTVGKHGLQVVPDRRLLIIKRIIGGDPIRIDDDITGIEG